MPSKPIRTSAALAEPLEARRLLSGSNLALNAPAVASSVESSQFPASNATDASTRTRWSSSFADGQWLRVDLGGDYNISEVKLNWQTAYAKAYQLQLSDDANDWATIYTTTTGAGGVQDIKNLSGTGRYLRLLCVTRATPYGFSLYDVQAFGAAAPSTPVVPTVPTNLTATLNASNNLVTLNWSASVNEAGYVVQRSTDGGTAWADDATLSATSPSFADGDIAAGHAYSYRVRATGKSGEADSGYSNVASATTPPGGTPTNVALGKLTAASSIESSLYPASNATDASASTRWSSAFGDNQWIEVDLGQSYAISSVKLVWQTAYAKSYKLQVSSDGSTWTDVYFTTVGKGGPANISGLNAIGRYVRMLGVTRATPYGYSLYDFQVLGVPVTTGLTGAYFADTTFTGTPIIESDATINFAWGTAAPVSGVVAGSPFSARWTGQIVPAQTQTYTFDAGSDGSVRLWVNHQLIVDDWTTHAKTDDVGQIALIAGHAVDVQIEYASAADGAAGVTLSWSGAAMPTQIVPATALVPANQDLLSELDHAVAFAGDQYQATVTGLLAASNPYATYPQYTYANNTWETVAGSSWAAGFFSGTLWNLYQLTGNSYWETQASAWTTNLNARVNAADHDGLWGMFNSYLARYQATGSAADLQMVKTAGNLVLAEFNSTVNAFYCGDRKSTSGNPNANFGVLMDMTMDLPLVVYVGQLTGNMAAVNDVVTHVMTLGNSLVRQDGSTAQWGYFNSATGQYIGPEAYQAYSATSCWSRGQAWAIHAFTDIAQSTGSAAVLALARKVANYWVANVPADGVPYWDFNAPQPTVRDTSAAAVAASGLIQLSQLLKTSDPTASAKYLASAANTLASLAGPNYLSQGSGNPGAILHGATFVPLNPPIADNGMTLTDDYFLEAVGRYRAAVDV